MGNGRWAKALRFLVCFIIILAVMIYISQKRADCPVARAVSGLIRLNCES